MSDIDNTYDSMTEFSASSDAMTMNTEMTIPEVDQEKLVFVGRLSRPVSFTDISIW